MKNVLRNGENGEITHILYTVINGIGQYLTKDDYEKLYDLNEKDTAQYYSGNDSEELESLKEDITAVMMGELTKEQLKLRIALSNGLIEHRNILEISGE